MLAIEAAYLTFGASIGLVGGFAASFAFGVEARFWKWLSVTVCLPLVRRLKTRIAK